MALKSILPHSDLRRSYMWCRLSCMTLVTTTTCTYEGCPKLGKYSTDSARPDLKGLCHDHQLASGGAGCDFSGCDRPRVAITSGMCTGHARQLREGLELTTLLRGPKHGSATTYRNYKCRCEDCVTAWNKACAARRAKNVGRTYEGDKQHGSTTAYQYGCRCVACKKVYCSVPYLPALIDTCARSGT